MIYIYIYIFVNIFVNTFVNTFLLIYNCKTLQRSTGN